MVKNRLIALLLIAGLIAGTAGYLLFTEAQAVKWTDPKGELFAQFGWRITGVLLLDPTDSVVGAWLT